MQRKTILTSMFILLLIHIASAYTLDSVSILDTIDGDSIQEHMVIRLLENSDDSFSIRLPGQARQVAINGEAAQSENGTYTANLACTTCYIVINYTMAGAIRDDGDGISTLSRTINLEQPRTLNYTIRLPLGVGLAMLDDPSAVPTPTSITTDGRQITLQWLEQEPSLPQAYLVKYENARQGSGILILLMAALIPAATLAYILLRKPKPVYPSTAFSQDERLAFSTLHSLIKEAGSKPVTQKDLARRLEWSKSKASAICISLERKGIIRRDKVGRNYRTQIIGKMDTDRSKHHGAN